jgi:hypothetical protein
MKKFSVIDFQNEKGTEEKLTEIFKRNRVRVIDWMEKDYGIEIFVHAHEQVFDRVLSEVGNVMGAMIGDTNFQD